MTKFKLDRYDVLVKTKDGPVAHSVTIYHTDELAAEKEAPTYGLAITVTTDGEVGNLLADHMRTLQVWAALTREGKYDKPFANFMRTDCLALQSAPEVVLDPTEGPLGSLSSSATTGLPFPSGSIQTDPAATTA